MSDRIVKAIEVKAPVDRVWRALTDHEEFGRWFRVKLDQPFALGGRSTGRITYPGYEHIGWEATVTRMEAPTLFAYTWPHPVNLENPEPDAPRTLVEFRLEPLANGGTRVTVIESGFEAVPQERRAKSMRENDGGWAEQMANIRAHVDG